MACLFELKTRKGMPMFFYDRWNVEVADRDVRPFTEVRSCLDYEI